VTTPDDGETRRIAESHGARVVLSTRCYDDDHSFNKGRMINDGLASLGRKEWIVLTDADIFGKPLGPYDVHVACRIGDQGSAATVTPPATSSSRSRLGSFCSSLLTRGGWHAIVNHVQLLRPKK